MSTTAKVWRPTRAKAVPKEKLQGRGGKPAARLARENAVHTGSGGRRGDFGPVSSLPSIPPPLLSFVISLFASSTIYFGSLFRLLSLARSLSRSLSQSRPFSVLLPPSLVPSLHSLLPCPTVPFACHPTHPLTRGCIPIGRTLSRLTLSHRLGTSCLRYFGSVIISCCNARSSASWCI